MIGYTKLFGSIVDSTIWREDDKTRILWITMLAMAGKEGIVEASIPGLADRARMSINECQAALARLEAPDPYSRTKDFDGRRVKAVDGGWAILNHGKYRDRMSADERREYLRNKQAEWRAKNKARNRPVNNGKQKSTLSTHTAPEAEADTEAGGDSTAPAFSEIPTKDEAFSATMNANIPRPFSDMVYDIWTSRSGKDGAGVVVKWLPYVTKRWASEQVEWRNKTHKGNKKTSAVPLGFQP